MPSHFQIASHHEWAGDEGFVIDATAIAESSLQSLNYHSGIQILEEYLLGNEVPLPPWARYPRLSG